MGGHNSSALLIISGPTGSGKSDLAHTLAEQFDLSIISADSRQVVRGFDIGSAKPSDGERERYGYRMLDLVDPGESFSAFAYANRTESEIKDVIASGRIPLICGGSGLYIRALTDGFFESPPVNPELRRKLEDQAEHLGPDEFHALLREVDPESAMAIHPHNVVRVVRALEIYHGSGETKSKLISKQKQSTPVFEYSQLALTPPIESVYERIDLRVDKMLSDGWETEVGELVETYGSQRIRAARAIGYSEFCDYLDGNMSFAETIELIKRNTRRFAKRQMTWLRSSKGVRMFERAEILSSEAAKLLNDR